MNGYLLAPFVQQAFERAFPEASPQLVYVSSKKLSFQVGPLYMRVVIEEALDDFLPGQRFLQLLGRGYNPFLVHPERLEGVLILHLRPLAFSKVPDRLSWDLLRSAAASIICLPEYARGNL